MRSSNPAQDDLADAIEGLYSIFSRYPLIEDVEYCDHCVPHGEVQQLHRTPLRNLGPDLLGPLLFNSTTVWGDQSYLNHFLPRLLEQVASGQMENWSYASFLPDRLRQPWQEGTTAEQEALDRFALAWWRTTITTHPSPCDIAEVLDTLRDGRQALATYLNAWPTDGGEAIARQLARITRDLMLSPYMPDADTWLRSPVPAQILEDGIASASSPEIAGELRQAHEHLVLYRNLS